jgi:C-terminal processing protease CtpA/Prc
MVTKGLENRSFNGKVVVLGNEHTTSSSEMVALLAREEIGAIVVGTLTPRKLVRHCGANLGHGLTLAVRVTA